MLEVGGSKEWDGWRPPETKSAESEGRPPRGSRFTMLFPVNDEAPDGHTRLASTRGG